MWFVLFGLGAAFLHRLRLPAALAALPYPPPDEARYALYFLLTALVRLAVRNARVLALEKRARRAAARRSQRFSIRSPGLLEVGAGVGRGVAEVMLGNLAGAALAGGALLLRMAASRPDDSALEARRAVERRKAVAREHRRAALCILGVGAVCLVAVWVPLAGPRLARLLEMGLATLR